jgi:hypothetical protein
VLQSLSEPDLDDRLPCQANTGGLTIELFDRPKGDIHFDALLLQAASRGVVELERSEHGVTSIEATIEFRIVHRALPPLDVSDEQKRDGWPDCDW